MTTAILEGDLEGRWVSLFLHAPRLERMDQTKVRGVREGAV